MRRIRSRLLRARRERPRRRRAAEKRDELAPPHVPPPRLRTGHRIGIKRSALEEAAMSALGQKRTFADAKVMSALPPKRTCAAHQAMSAMGQKRTFNSIRLSRAPQTVCFTHKSVHACFAPARCPLSANSGHPYSITSSARSNKDSRTERPRALAVLRLTASSNLSGDCTGRLPALSPLRMRSTYELERRKISTLSGP